MPVKNFMSENIAAIQEIINELPRPFDSHAFIRKFANRFQVEYVNLLHEHRATPFIVVHGQIALFLSDNQAALGITKNGKVRSENVFGLVNDNEQWV